MNKRNDKRYGGLDVLAHVEGVERVGTAEKKISKKSKYNSSGQAVSGS